MTQKRRRRGRSRSLECKSITMQNRKRQGTHLPVFSLVILEVWQRWLCACCGGVSEHFAVLLLAVRMSHIPAMSLACHHAHANAGPPQRPRAEKLINVLQLNGSAGFLGGRKKKCNTATIGRNLLQRLSAGCCHGDRWQDADTMRNASIRGRKKNYLEI